MSAQKNPVEFAKALADGTRQKIMNLCCCQWLNVGEIVEAVGVSQPTVSHHLAILREAGLVHTRQEGKHTFYSLNQQKVVSCCGQIMQVFAPDLVEESYD
jgi:ArsR family transcriptional regulator, arsenate/arsenite/antimonite-responsive transcriptional repressor